MPPMARILIVEDERDLVDLLQFNLRQAGHETSFALDGEQALERIKENLPDLVLLDLMLPDISGTEICKQLSACAKRWVRRAT